MPSASKPLGKISLLLFNLFLLSGGFLAAIQCHGRAQPAGKSFVETTRRRTGQVHAAALSCPQASCHGAFSAATDQIRKGENRRNQSRKGKPEARPKRLCGGIWRSLPSKAREFMLQRERSQPPRWQWRRSQTATATLPPTQTPAAPYRQGNLATLRNRDRQLIKTTSSLNAQLDQLFENLAQQKFLTLVCRDFRQSLSESGNEVFGRPPHIRPSPPNISWFLYLYRATLLAAMAESGELDGPGNPANSGWTETSAGAFNGTLRSCLVGHLHQLQYAVPVAGSIGDADPLVEFFGELRGAEPVRCVEVSDLAYHLDTFAFPGEHP
jgi:hypothetical protein